MTERKFRLYLALIVKKVVRIMVEREMISELEAIQAFYQSETYELLENEETKFWWFSPEELYEDYLSTMEDV